MEQIIARVAVAAATYGIDKPYDYIVPLPLGDKAVPGVRVTVPFGKGNKSSEALILSIRSESQRAELKVVSEVLDDAPVLDQSGMRLAFWLRERYFCTIYDAVKVILPAGLWFRVREVAAVRGDLTEEEADALLGRRRKLRQVWETLHALGGQADVETLRERLGDGVISALNGLAKLDMIVLETSALRRMRDKTVKRVSLAVPQEEALAMVAGRRYPLRRSVVELLCAVGSALAPDVCYFTGASPQTLKSLEKSGIVAMTEEERYRVPDLRDVPPGPPILLNEEQQEAYDGILELTKKGPACALLYGVTGSGKTEVYIRLLQEMVRQGKTGMILVPEIALTPQMMERFSRYFGSKVAMLHSGLRVSERYDQWKRIRSGAVRVVLGTRSAVFAPLPDLGMIILDEEQEGSYHSEQTPRYHARDVAKYRCSESGAVLVLGSATPTVESAYYAQTGRYRLFPLRRRYNAMALPEVTVADLRQELRQGNSGVISESLRRELAENLRRGEQTILFLNRRGSSRMLVCGECGAVPECPRCSVPMTYHSANGRLMCHYCGYSQQGPDRCEECGGLMKSVGAGTQKVEEELHTLFPGAEVLRMDADTVAGGHEKLLRRFREEQIPILLGTQMVAKGLDFPNVTLVGVLLADQSLYVDHYQASERTFALLTQVVGRAGRGSCPGRAVIQTFTPDNDVIQSAVRQDYAAFYRQELRMRRILQNPPFADLFTLTISGGEEGTVLRAAALLRDGLKRGLTYPSAANLQVEIVGPAPAPILKINNRYRYRLFWIGRNDHQTREMLAHYYKAFYSQKENRGLQLTIDCNTPD